MLYIEKYLNKVKSMIPRCIKNYYVKNEGYYEWTVRNWNNINKYGTESPKFDLINERW